MNIALIAHDGKKELMVQFCLAYAGILSRHELCATGTTGSYLLNQTGLPVKLMMDGSQGGLEQVGARIELGEIDLVLLFADPKHDTCAKDAGYLSYLCARGNVPLAINIATAEALILALSRGDLDWREAMKESTELTAHAKAVLEYR